eukprot:CAMPEP_0204183166 /NCGR_PEP_ID=MMETSP0361-20130328/53384_1 /ASSEMBLY_ACC=CAM_ASM_000343 /TAXON_ID=268821 /ORGANISM="Scrippsiella Hangoei, Strain SHTV-5" /LENGTH=88 /DNA_ID=CAMNT_0051143021 /DNA_START=207 /DNA_END=470 /DNA_ORIENTATION=-
MTQELVLRSELTFSQANRLQPLGRCPQRCNEGLDGGAKDEARAFASRSANEGQDTTPAPHRDGNQRNLQRNAPAPAAVPSKRNHGFRG